LPLSIRTPPDETGSTAENSPHDGPEDIKSNTAKCDGTVLLGPRTERKDGKKDGEDTLEKDVLVIEPETPKSTALEEEEAKIAKSAPTETNSDVQNLDVIK